MIETIKRLIKLIRHYTTDYCIICDKQHKYGRIKEYCHACHKVHRDIFWKYRPIDIKAPRTGRIESKYVHICGEYERPQAMSAQKKMESYSPAEVLAGVPFGGKLEGSSKNYSEEDWSKEHAREVKQIKEALR